MPNESSFRIGVADSQTKGGEMEKGWGTGMEWRKRRKSGVEWERLCLPAFDIVDKRFKWLFQLLVRTRPFWRPLQVLFTQQI